MPHNVEVKEEGDGAEALWDSLEAEAVCLQRQAVVEMHKGDYGKSRRLYRKAAELFELADCLRGYEDTKHIGSESGLSILLYTVCAVLLALVLAVVVLIAG